MAMSHGFDVGRFLEQGEPRWKELAKLLDQADAHGLRRLGLRGTRHFGKLYRRVSSDLIRARTELVDVAVTDHLNAMVARAYAHIYARSAARPIVVAGFFARDFPRLFRREWRPTCVAAALLVAGATFGALASAFDREALAVMIPEEHATGSPSERVAAEHARDSRSADEAAGFSSFLFTHNIQVAFLVFALGLTYGVGTVSVLFLNGVPLGALAIHYHMDGQGLFFWAWILPHGIIELTVICIAGGAGLIVARGLLTPGRRRRRDALVEEGRVAARLVMGGMPILVLAGVVEGTLSQLHEPVVPYWAKLLAAALTSAAVWCYLLLAGRADSH